VRRADEANPGYHKEYAKLIGLSGTYSCGQSGRSRPKAISREIPRDHLPVYMKIIALYKEASPVRILCDTPLEYYVHGTDLR
jgi:hypothetical protein